MGKKKSAKDVWYKQCTLSSPTEGGTTKQIAWIPASFAVIGKVVYLGKKTDNPERLWTVTSAAGRQSGAYLGEHERDYVTQRQASDI